MLGSSPATTVESTLSADKRTRTYRTAGEIFFASGERLADDFDSRRSSIAR
jgi:hypothetical protein